MIDIEVYTEILSQTANLTEAPEYIRVLPFRSVCQGRSADFFKRFRGGMSALCAHIPFNQPFDLVAHSFCAGGAEME